MKYLLVLASTIVLACAASAAELKIPKEVKLPDLEPMVPACADPAVDRFIEVDLLNRPPPGATRIQRLGAWVTPDGVFHWPFVMRVRNLGDQPFVGKPGGQAAVVTEDDLLAGKKGRVAASVAFDRIAQHSGVAVRFEFTAPADQIEKGKFRRVFTLALKYRNEGVELITGRNGDCNLKNNAFSIEFDGGKKTWVSAK